MMIPISPQLLLDNLSGNAFFSALAVSDICVTCFADLEPLVCTFIDFISTSPLISASRVNLVYVGSVFCNFSPIPVKIRVSLIKMLEIFLSDFSVFDSVQSLPIEPRHVNSANTENDLFKTILRLLWCENYLIIVATLEMLVAIANNIGLNSHLLNLLLQKL